MPELKSRSLAETISVPRLIFPVAYKPPKYSYTIDGFPIEIETRISKLITYSLAIFVL